MSRSARGVDGTHIGADHAHEGSPRAAIHNTSIRRDNPTDRAQHRRGLIAGVCACQPPMSPPRRCSLSALDSKALGRGGTNRKLPARNEAWAKIIAQSPSIASRGASNPPPPLPCSSTTKGGGRSFFWGGGEATIDGPGHARTPTNCAAPVSPRSLRLAARVLRLYYSSTIGMGATRGLSCIMYVMIHLRTDGRAAGAWW